MSKLVSYVRSLRATPLGRYIPGNKVLAGALAGLASAYLAKQNVVNVSPVDVSLGAFALVSYLLPESPVAAAHVVAKAGTVTIQRIAKISGTVDINTSPAYNALKDTLHGVPVQNIVAPQPPSPDATPEQPAGVQAPYVGPSQA